MSNDHSTDRIKIRCPNCRKDGSARAELMNRRVACKHCAHIFRALPVAEPSGSPAPPAGPAHARPGRESSRSRIKILVREIRKLRDELSARPGPTPPGPDPSEIEALRGDLARAGDAARNAEARRRDAEAASEARERARVAEAEELRRLLEQASGVACEAEARRIAARAKSDDREQELLREVARLHERLGAAQATRPAEPDPTLEAEVRSLRGELARARAAEADRAEADRGRDDESRRLREELEAARDEASRARDERAAELGDLRERIERERADSRAARDAHDSAVAGLRGELDRAAAALAEAEEARRDRDRLAEEVRALRGRLEEREWLAAGNPPGDEEDEGRSSTWGASGTEAEVSPHLEATDPRIALLPADFGLDDSRSGSDATLGDFAPAPVDAAEALRAALAEALAVGERRLAEIEALRARLDEATARGPAGLAPPRPAAAGDPARIEAERLRAAEEAAKGAWADFERRLAETQGRLKAANRRADLLEAEAREAREQVAAFRRDLDLGELSSSDDIGSVTGLRIMADRGSARLTQAEADARLALARRLAVERKDRALIDRIDRVAEKVRDDLDARNYTLADTLVRGAEIEAGIDPGGRSIGGLKIFRPGQSIAASLAALAPAFDRAMRQGDPAAIRATIAEMRTILGDQAGLPEIRRPGRAPGARRPVVEAEAARLFLDAIEAEAWLIRPIAAGRPLPDTALGTYAGLIEGSCDARAAVERHARDRLETLDRVVQVAAPMLLRRQQADGHFPFLDPRGRPSPAASVVEAMVAAQPGSVKDGWVVAVDPAGLAQAETAACGIALARAGAVLGRDDWAQAALRAADWTLGQPCLPHFPTNALAASQLARAYLEGRKPAHLEDLIRRVAIGLLPGQAENGRWIDPVAAQTTDHLTILRALHDAWSAIPADRQAVREELAASVERAMNSLLEESARIGAPANGSALRDLVRHRDLFGPDARLADAILDSAAVVHELCHEGSKPRLGVPPDQLAALTRACGD